jgi:hypothetical protein
LAALSVFGAQLAETQGIVQVQSRSAQGWVTVRRAPLELSSGDSIRTGYKAKAVVELEDGSRVELAGGAELQLREASTYRTDLELAAGALKAFVKKLGGTRIFKVRTQTAVASVRGTEFRVEVMGGGRTRIDLYKGLLGVEDKLGQQILMKPGQRLDIDLRGMGNPDTAPSPVQSRKTEFQTLMRRELKLDMSKEEVQAAAAREVKLAEFQQGKALIDAFGHRVRVEEYIVRPAADQFKLVVLNERTNRFDWFYYLGTFNQALPADLSVALRQLSGTIDTAPTWWLTAFETGRSNTRDSAVELAQGGHPVDVNNNLDPGDDVNFFYDGESDRFIDSAGRAVYQTLFDRYGFYLNGKLKYGWTGAALQTYADATPSFNTDPITGAALAQPLAARTVNTIFPSEGLQRQVIYESYADGTFIQWDNFIINDEGRVATISDFKGRPYKQAVLDFNFQQVMTATEFEGRKIDLVVEPKIFIRSGLLR